MGWVTLYSGLSTPLRRGGRHPSPLHRTQTPVCISAPFAAPELARVDFRPGCGMMGSRRGERHAGRQAHARPEGLSPPLVPPSCNTGGKSSQPLRVVDIGIRLAPNSGTPMVITGIISTYVATPHPPLSRAQPPFRRSFDRRFVAPGPHLRGHWRVQSRHRYGCSARCPAGPSGAC